MNQRRILLVLLLFAVALAASWLLLTPSEPIYQGKPLTYWLDGVALQNHAVGQKEAIEAVQQIGTHAIPMLLRMLKARDSKFKLKLVQLAQKQHLIIFKWNMAPLRHTEAAYGFWCLGPQARSAVPALIEISNSRRPGWDEEPVTIDRIFAGIGPAAADAVPRLVQDITDTNVLISLTAVEAVGKIDARPDLAVPALIRSLRDRDIAIRVNAASSLGTFGSDAKSAVPELVNALADTYYEVRYEAAAVTNTATQ